MVRDVYIHFKAERKGNRKPLYHWQLTNYKALPLLLAIKPYLIIKRMKADIAIRMLQGHSKWRRFTPMEKFLQEADAKAIKVLNKRGIQKSTLTI